MFYCKTPQPIKPHAAHHSPTSTLPHALQVEDVEFEEGEVYAIDCLVSTGEGKPK